MKSNKQKDRQSLLTPEARSTSSSFASSHFADHQQYQDATPTPSEIRLENSRSTSSNNSNGSSASVAVIMNHKFKQNILRNHLFLIILLTAIHLGTLLFAMIWPAWYDDTSNYTETHGVVTQYGLILLHSGNHIRLNGLNSENNKEIGGVSAFALFSLGVLIQILQFAQFLSFFKRYSQTNQATAAAAMGSTSTARSSWKLLKFKTCRRISFFFYVSAMSYWIVVVFFVQVVTDASNYSELLYGFWVTLASIAGFLLVSVYFNFLKKQIRKNDMVSSLLLASNATIPSSSMRNTAVAAAGRQSYFTPSSNPSNRTTADIPRRTTITTPINSDEAQL